MIRLGHRGNCCPGMIRAKFYATRSFILITSMDTKCRLSALHHPPCGTRHQRGRLINKASYVFIMAHFAHAAWEKKSRPAVNRNRKATRRTKTTSRWLMCRKMKIETESESNEGDLLQVYARCTAFPSRQWLVGVGLGGTKTHRLAPYILPRASLLYPLAKN